MVTVIETERLRLVELAPPDAAFILELLNEPSFLANIGDRGVHDLEGAVRYINEGQVANYARLGYGLWLVRRKDDGAAMGLSGLVRRVTLPEPDIGYAFLPRYWGQGYAVEACAAVLAHALGPLALPRVLAIVSPGNEASTKVLDKIGLAYQRTVQLGDDSEQLLLYASDAA